MLNLLKAFGFERLFPGGMTRQSWRAVIGGLIGALSIMGAAGGVVWAARESQIREWTRFATDLSLMVAEQARQSIKASDLVLRAITDRVQETGIESTSEFEVLMSSKDVFELLRQRAAGVPQIDVATVVGVDGVVLNFTRWWPAAAQTPPFAKINLADRDYFKAQMADPTLDTYISAPVQNRGTGTWTFYLSHKIRSKSGKVLGIALTGLHVEFFSDFYKAISGASDRTFSLFRDDGVLMSRYPVREDFLGRSFRQGSVIALGLTNHSDYGASFTRTPRVTEPGDTRARITSPRRVPDYPLLVNSVLYEDEFLASWWSDTRHILLLASGLAVLIMGLSISLASLLSRQSATMKELETARHTAESAAAAKSEFLAMMSHEIRTPINAVIGMSDALLEGQLPDRERGMARIVNEASSHLLTIVNTILDFSRLEAGQDRSTNAAYELRHVVRSAMELASGLPGASKLSITSHVGDDVPEYVIGDQGRVTQVLLNLLGNAVKFTDKGSVDLSVSRIRPIEGVSPAMLRFAITDTGTGITRAMADRLFEPFERGEGWKSHKGSGTGLGLAISKRLVGLMGGVIGADGEPGLGSVFWFELPLREAEAAPVPAPAVSDAPSSQRIEILVAEDSVTSQLVARHFLESLGHSVTIVENGSEALSAVQHRHYDLVLMDGHMPVMDGLEATREIRALGGRFLSLPIYGLSANVLNSDREQATRVGMNGYLTKPVRKQEIAAVIAQLYPATQS